MLLNAILPLLLLAGPPAATASAAKKPPAPSVDADFKKAVGLYAQGKTAEALPLFKKVQKTKPARPDVYYYIGLCDAKAPNHELAITDFTKAIQLNENDTDAYLERGNSYMALNKYAEAAADFGEIVQRDAGNTTAWYGRGRAYSLLKSDQQAATSYEQVIQIEPTHAYAHYYLGLAYYNLKQKDKAVTHLQAFVKLMPDAPEAAWVRRLLQQLSSW